LTYPLGPCDGDGDRDHGDCPVVAAGLYGHQVDAVLVIERRHMEARA
jgi:hypothetical protein